MDTLQIGADYYYLDSSDFAIFSSSLAGTGYTIEDFPYFHSVQSGYEGYYFVISEIDDGEEGGPEWDILAQYGSFGFANVWESVQANYMG